MLTNVQNVSIHATYDEVLRLMLGVCRENSKHHSCIFPIHSTLWCIYVTFDRLLTKIVHEKEVQLAPIKKGKNFGTSFAYHTPLPFAFAFPCDPPRAKKLYSVSNTLPHNFFLYVPPFYTIDTHGYRQISTDIHGYIFYHI